MKAEILATGDEIRSGALVDSNSAYIADKLEESGIEVMRHHSIGDDTALMTDVLLEISYRSDIAVVTGGLGPTTDDVTSEAAARAAGVKLVLNESALEDIRSLFKKIGRPMSPSNEKQAKFPAGAEWLKNPVGTAPGFSIKIGRCIFYFVPGVPFEMQRMIADHVMPSIIQIQGGTTQHSLVRTISTFGLGESVVGEKIASVTQEFKEVKLGLRASFPEIQIKLYIRGEDENYLKKKLDEAAGWVIKRMDDYVFSSDGRPMEEVVGDLLKSKSGTLALAESCTGGLAADLITSIPGSSDYFLFSGVTYSNESKIRVLGVKTETLNRYGAVSEETAREMAEGARRIANATYGLATSGIAGPAGGTDDKPVGTVCIGLATQKKSTAKKWITPFSRLGSSYGTRLANKRLFAMMALETLRREIMGIK